MARLLGAVAAAIAVAVLAGGCTAGGSNARNRSYSRPLPARARIYHDAAGWSVDVPRGWHVVRFRSARGGASATGAQISDAGLPPPAVMPGFPIQASSLRLPARGVSLVIATDYDRRVCQPGARPVSCQRHWASLPLAYPAGWTMGSAPAGAPTIAIVWFRAGGMAFVATIKTGAAAPAAASRQVAAIVASLRYRSSPSR
jgi:hypothetical protein